MEHISPYAQNEEALRSLVRTNGKEVYALALNKTGNPDTAKAISRRVLKSLMELPTDTPEEFRALYARSLTRESLACWELDMLRASLWTEDPGILPVGMIRQIVPEAAEDMTAPEPVLAAMSLNEEKTVHDTPKRKKPRLEPEPEEEDTGKAGRAIAAIFLVILCIALLWLALGLFMRLGILPAVDLGYRFFNARVLPLF